MPGHDIREWVRNAIACWEVSLLLDRHPPHITELALLRSVGIGFGKGVQLGFRNKIGHQ